MSGPAPSDPRQQLKARRRRAYDALAPERDRWIERNRTYHHALRALLRAQIPAGASVLQVGCGTGDLLAAVRPGRGVGLDLSLPMLREARRKYPHLAFVQGDAESLPIGPTFDYVVLANVVGDLADVWRAFRELRAVTRPDSRILVVYYNALWRPLIQLGQRLGWKMPELEHNWLSLADLTNLLELNDFETVVQGGRVLLPLQIRGLTSACNRLLATLPGMRRLCLVHYLAARPLGARAAAAELSCSVVIPTRNEAGNVALAVASMPRMGSHTEILFVDGHSTDGTVERIEAEIERYRGEKDIRLLHQVPRGADGSDADRMLALGKADAVRKGFDAARGDVLMILDGDVTVPPEDLPMFFAALAEGHGEFANGSRLVYPLESDAMPAANRVANKLFGLLFTWTLDQRITDTLCGTKALLRDDYRRIAASRAAFGDFDPFGDFELLFGAARLGRKIVEVPVRYRARSYGAVKIRRWSQGLVLAWMWWIAFRRFKLGVDAPAGPPRLPELRLRRPAWLSKLFAPKADAIVPLSRAHRVAFALCAAGVFALVGARLAHYAAPWPEPLHAVFSTLMRGQIYALMIGFVLGPATLASALVALALIIVRRRWLFATDGTRWLARPWLHSAVWGSLLVFNPALDMDRPAAIACGGTLLAGFAALTLWPLLGRTAAWLRGLWRWPRHALPAVLAIGAWGCLLALMASIAPREIGLVSFAGWPLLLTALGWLAARGLARRDLVWLGLLGLLAVQFLTALQLLPRDPGAVRIGGDGYAYTFCEIPERHQLFAAVPCDSGSQCKRGFVAEHDTRDLSKRVEHVFFDDHYEGRLVHLVCLESSVQVGLSRSVVDGKAQPESVLEFKASNPRVAVRNLFDGQVGSRLAWDRRRDAVYYTSEFSRRIFRYDRRTGEIDRNVAEIFYGKSSDANAFGSHLVENDAFHAGRDSLFFAQWLSGSRVFELGLERRELLASYEPHDGGNHGVTVDDELDRLWVTGVWGVDVLEIPSGRRLANAWLGLGTRLPVIDRRHDLVYVPTISARMWVLDRRSFELLGSFHVGGGSRNPYLSADGRHLFVGSLFGYAYWDTDELARRFRYAPAPAVSDTPSNRVSGGGGAP